MSAELQAKNDIPLTALLTVGYKPTVNTAVFGDVWYQPTRATMGADIAARYKENLDVYAGGWIDGKGGYGAEVGTKFRF